MCVCVKRLGFFFYLFFFTFFFFTSTSQSCAHENTTFPRQCRYSDLGGTVLGNFQGECPRLGGLCQAGQQGQLSRCHRSEDYSRSTGIYSWTSFCEKTGLIGAHLWTSLRERWAPHPPPPAAAPLTACLKSQ